MDRNSAQGRLFESENVWSVLLKIAPPVMLAQLIQANHPDKIAHHCTSETTKVCFTRKRRV